MAFTFTTSGAMTLKAGNNANSNITVSGAYLTQLSDEVESTINTITRYNWTDVYSTLNTDVKYVLQDAASSMAAISLITYDMSGFTSRSEAQTMLDVLDDRASKAIKELTDIKNRDFVTKA